MPGGVEISAPLVTVRIKFYDEYNVIQRVPRDTAHRKKAVLTKEGGLPHLFRPSTGD